MIFEDFPHDWLFYNEYMNELIASNEASSDQSIPITLVINLLPIASNKYCKQNNMEPIFKWNTSKTSYNSILESMKPPFDKDDEICQRILEYYITLFVGESLFVLLEKSTEPLSDILVDLLKDIFSHYSTKEMPSNYVCRISFLEKIFNEAQEIWSRCFGLMSKTHFEDWCKMIQKTVTEDLNNEEEDSVTPNLKLNFFKHLWITPTRKLVSSHVLFLLNHFNHALSSKRLKISTKSSALEALKWLLTHLNFKEIAVSNSSSSIEDEKQEMIEDPDLATKLLWPSVKSLYDHCYRLTKSNALRTKAIKVMIAILRKSPLSFFVKESHNFPSKIKLTNLLEYNASFLEGLKLVFEMIKGVERYGDYTDMWYPKIDVQLCEKGDFSIEFRHSTRKYNWHRIEAVNGQIYEILSPKDAFEAWFGTSKGINNSKIDMVRNWEDWKKASEILHKIMLQIWVEDLEFAWEYAIPSLIELGNSRLGESEGKFIFNHN